MSTLYHESESNSTVHNSISLFLFWKIFISDIRECVLSVMLVVYEFFNRTSNPVGFNHWKMKNFSISIVAYCLVDDLIYSLRLCFRCLKPCHNFS